MVPGPEGLLEVSEKVTDLTKVVAQSLAEEVGSYWFLMAVSSLQSANMQLDVAVELLTETKTSLTDYRATGLASAQSSAIDVCEEMNVEAVLKVKIQESTENHFNQ